MKQKRNVKKDNPIIYVWSLLIIVALCIATYFCWTTLANKGTGSTVDPSFSLTIDTMLGGGIAGAVDTYMLHADGQLYHVASDTYSSPQTKTLVRTISRDELVSLENLIKDSGIMKEDGGSGPQYGSEQWDMTYRGQRKTFYGVASAKFDGVRNRIHEIIQKK